MVLSVVDVFERLHIPYLVGGSMASALYGVARSTLDVDLVVELLAEQGSDADSPCFSRKVRESH